MDLMIFLLRLYHTFSFKDHGVVFVKNGDISLIVRYCLSHDNPHNASIGRSLCIIAPWVQRQENSFQANYLKQGIAHIHTYICAFLLMKMAGRGRLITHV